MTADHMSERSLQHFVMGIRIPALRTALKFAASCS